MTSGHGNRDADDSGCCSWFFGHGFGKNRDVRVETSTGGVSGLRGISRFKEIKRRKLEGCEVVEELDMLMKMMLWWRLAIPRRMGWAGCAGERKKRKEKKPVADEMNGASTRARPQGERRKRQEGYGGKSVREKRKRSWWKRKEDVT